MRFTPRTFLGAMLAGVVLSGCAAKGKVNAADTEGPTANLAGVWIDESGHPCTVKQSGESASICGRLRDLTGAFIPRFADTWDGTVEGRVLISGDFWREMAIAYKERIEVSKPILAAIKDEVANRA